MEGGRDRESLKIQAFGFHNIKGISSSQCFAAYAYLSYVFVDFVQRYSVLKFKFCIFFVDNNKHRSSELFLSPRLFF